MNDAVMNEIRGLSREQALEAAGFLAGEFGLTSATNQQSTAVLADWADRPYGHVDEAEELARLLLSAAAAMPDHQAAVRKAIEGVGRKQVVLAGAEIVALAALALGALQIIASGGKTSEEISETIETSEDGKQRTIRIHNTKWGISSSLGVVLRRALSAVKSS